MRLHGQACGAAGKARNVRHLCAAQFIGTLAEREEAAHGAAAEDVACAGGVHDVNPLRGIDRDRAVSVGGVAALRAERGVDERDTVRSIKAGAKDCVMTLRLILDGESAELFVNDGEHVISSPIDTPADAQGIAFCADGELTVDVEKHTLG